MLYKEWITVRQKFAMWLGLYGLMAFLEVAVFSRPSPGTIYVNSANFVPMYNTWLMLSTLLTVFTSMIGGLDVLAEEVDRGTISFLLTRPVSRTRIYTSKILMNIGALGVALGLSSTAMWIIDRLSLNPIKFWEAAGGSLLVFLMGAGIICLSGLVAIFARNVLQTLAFTLAVVVLTIAACAYVNYFISQLHLERKLDLVFNPALGLAVFLVVVPPALFATGLFFFKRKEF
jgi:ABC-2 type transport system permease protein